MLRVSTVWMLGTGIHWRGTKHHSTGRGKMLAFRRLGLSQPSVLLNTAGMYQTAPLGSARCRLVRQGVKQHRLLSAIPQFNCRDGFEVVLGIVRERREHRYSGDGFRARGAMSPADKRKIAAAQRKRWAAWRKSKN